MTDFSASPFNNFIRAVGRFFGFDLLLVFCALIAPSIVFPWFIRNFSNYLEINGELSFYAPYFALIIFFIATAFLRIHLLEKEGLASPPNFNPRILIGNLIIISAVAAIALKRHEATTVDYTTMHERSVVAIDILFSWAIANFFVQIARNLLQYFSTNKGE